MPPGHSLGRSCSWCPSLRGQYQAHCCCRGFLACGPARSPPAEGPFPVWQKTLSPHSLPKHKWETQIRNNRMKTNLKLCFCFNRFILKLKFLFIKNRKSDSQDRWCCTVSQKWKQASCSHPGCTAWQSLCTLPWMLWFQTLYLKTQKYKHSSYKNTSPSADSRNSWHFL